MKKKLLLLALILLPMVTYSRDHSIKIIIGDPQVLMQPDKTMALIMDYSGLMIEGSPAMEYLKSRGPDHERDFHIDNKAAREWFVVRWNNEYDSYTSIVESKKSDYEMKVHFKEMDLGSYAKANWSLSKRGGGIVISGIIYVTDSNGNNLLTLIFDNYRGKKMDAMEVKDGQWVQANRFKNRTSDGYRRKIGYMCFAEDIMKALKNPEYIEQDDEALKRDIFVDNNRNCFFYLKGNNFISTQNPELDYVIYDVYSMNASNIQGAIKLATKTQKSLGEIETISENVLQLNGYGENVFSEKVGEEQYEYDIAYNLIIQIKDEKIKYNKPIIKSIVKKNQLGEKLKMDMHKSLSELIPDADSQTKVEVFFKDIINELNNATATFNEW